MGLMTIGVASVERQASEAAEIAARAALVAEADYWCRHVTAQHVADRLAETLNVRVDDVWWALLRVPSNLAALFDSPEGWRALSEAVAGALGVPCRYLVAAVH